MQIEVHTDIPPFPIYAGVILGIGLGAFFDGIVLHQLLQWHHMVSRWYPINSVENLRLNTYWDGIFHAFAYVIVVTGVYLLLRTPHKYDQWSVFCMCGSLLLGWGLFNTIEGIINHEILGVHRVRETVPVDEQFLWDMGFLGWGAAMVAIGVLLIATCRTR